MKDVITAAGRALRSLRQPGMFWHLVWPALAAALLWLVLAYFGWDAATRVSIGFVSEWPWLGHWMNASAVVHGFVAVMVSVTLAFGLLPLMYLTAALLVSAVALPLMLERVSRRDYADLEARQAGSNLGSVWNSMMAGGVFLLLLLLSLPLWLIPGAGFVISVLLTARLNRSAFAYDALMVHADAEELERLPRTLQGPMLWLGGGFALLAHVPVVNLLAPALTGLAFVHYMLESLRRDRLRESAGSIQRTC